MGWTRKASDTLTPSSSPVQVKVYRITGRQLFFSVGRSVCEECDLTVATVKKAIAGIEGIPVRFKAEAWLNKLPVALAERAYHPPITLVNGKIIAQGVVPDVEEVRSAIRRAVGREGESED